MVEFLKSDFAPAQEDVVAARSYEATKSTIGVCLVCVERAATSSLSGRA